MARDLLVPEEVGAKVFDWMMKSHSKKTVAEFLSLVVLSPFQGEQVVLQEVVV